MFYFKESPLFVTGLQKILTSVWPCAGRALHCRDGYKGWHHAARKVPGEGTAGHCGGYWARLSQPGDVPIVIKKKYFFCEEHLILYFMVFGRKERYTQSVWRLERKSSYQSMVELKLFLMTRCRWLFFKKQNWHKCVVSCSNQYICLLQDYFLFRDGDILGKYVE